tara:strand:+ start:3413 stop:5518 length:2106 start_codon:yes stop_codon:yes gene_type:complete
MARINSTKASQIILYLYAQGYKAGGARQIGPDIADYLISTGHTFANPTVEKKIRSMPSAGWSSMMANDWPNNAANVSGLFGIDAYNIDKYTQQLGYSGVVSSPRGAPFGADKGGKGRGAKGRDFNKTGWDTVNLDSIATDGRLHPDYVAKLQNLAGGTPFRDEFERGNPRYQVGSKLATYSGSVPTISAVSATPTTPTPTPTVEPDEEVIEAVIEAIDEIADSIVADLVQYQVTDDLSVFLKDGETFVPNTEGERKVSSKAYAANSGVFEITTGTVQVTMPKLSNEIAGIDLLIGAEDPVAIMKAYADMTNIVIIKDADEEDMEVVAAPQVHFIIDAVEKQVFISINDMVIPAVRNNAGQPYVFDKLSIVVDEPSRSNKVIDVLIDGSSLITGKTISDEKGKYNEYGFPFAGVEGLPVNCYPDNYEDEGAVGAGPIEKAAQALNRFIVEGGRPVRFGSSPQSITYNLDMLDESVLQPLALDFDTDLDLDTMAIAFNLIYQSPNDSSNLFPGFDINTGLPVAETVLFPDDVRNLRPVNEDQKVMLQKFTARRAGQGIDKIRIASSNLQGMADIKLGDLTLNTELYTQVEVTFEDGSVMLIPDGDERFKALDNANNEIQGVISLNEVSNKPNIMVLSSDVKESYEALEKARRSARISDKFNRKNADNKIITQTAMIQQDSTYYIVMGVGDNTVVVELDMSKEE